MRLKDKVSIVTGSGRGIGKAIAERFAQEGAKVVIAERDDVGAEVEASLQAIGRDAVFIQTDVADSDARQRLVQETMRHYGRIDILVNNAAIFFPRSIWDMTQEDWRQLLAVNLDAVFFLSQAVAPIMKKQQYGRIINIASVNGWLGAADTAHYNAAKGGVLQVTRCLAVELAPYNIVVNAISPGFIKTRMSIVGGVDETETEFFQTFYVKHRRIPMGRAGRPEEVASAALFLASDDCQYMTGQMLVVDGGLSITF